MRHPHAHHRSRRLVGRSLLLLAVLLVAGAARADRACLGDPAVTGRTCSEAVCLSLQAAVDNACKNQQIFRCSRLDTCPALIEMRSRWVACGNARDRINGTCWRGGDPGHTQASIQAWQNVGNCNARIADKCDDCPWDDILGLTSAAPAPLSVDASAAPAAAAGDAVLYDLLAQAVEGLAAEGALTTTLDGETAAGDADAGDDEAPAPAGAEERPE